MVDTIAGGGNGDGYSEAVGTVRPDAVSVGPDGNVYIADSLANRIRRIDPQTGLITTLAGAGGAGFAGDGGPAVQAQLWEPTSAAADDLGNVYICDQKNHRIRKVDANGIISTVAGSTSGY
jgi:sugar lactone lactonase YvrE